METPAQASRATVARHTSRTHRVVNDVEVGGAWRLHHPPCSIFVLSEDRGIAGVSTSSALRDGSPSSLSPTYPYTLSTARRLIAELVTRVLPNLPPFGAFSLFAVCIFWASSL